jgi:hypothetical protein
MCQMTVNLGTRYGRAVMRQSILQYALAGALIWLLLCIANGTCTFTYGMEQANVGHRCVCC